ncbi:MAG: NAD(P)-dependent oxidoreductase [Parcubacteria group bacterium]|jgi:dTDP-4-dehydrorhamnose reductase
MQKILILGAKGMLGQELVEVYKGDKEYEVTAWDQEDIDVTDLVALRQKVTDLLPDVIFNAVAYNAVDACEEDDQEYLKAEILNSDVPEELAKIAKNIQAKLVHYSTDYVFDGECPKHSEGEVGVFCDDACVKYTCENSGNRPSYYTYREDDAPHPLSRYGLSKLHGEQNVARYADHYYIIRLSKLFGKPAISAVGKKSFFDMMRELGDKSGKAGAEQFNMVKAVDGEVSKFTYAPDLARVSKDIIEKNLLSGIIHVANDGVASWYDGAKELFDILGFTTEIVPVPPETFPRPAKRPASSVLSVTKVPQLRHYRDALREYVEKKDK